MIFPSISTESLKQMFLYRYLLDTMMERGKRGQAAMEFLMTYGWALLVVLVATGE